MDDHVCECEGIKEYPFQCPHWGREMESEATHRICQGLDPIPDYGMTEDQRQGYFKSWSDGSTAESTTVRNDDISCTSRSKSPIRVEMCQGCGGGEDVPRNVFACSIHGECCTLVGVPGQSMKVCQSCPDKTTRPTLSIVMATYDDYSGVWATVYSLAMEAREIGIDAQIEFVVADQKPDGVHGQRTKGILRDLKIGGFKTQYVPFTATIGTAAGKNAAIISATGEWVILVDCHVVFHPGSLAKTYSHIEANRESTALYGGVLMYNDLKNVSTHQEIWRSEKGIEDAKPLIGDDGVWGNWATDKRGVDFESEPFDIPSCAGWLLMFRRDQWQGYHPAAKGFGGEEGYLASKWKSRGLAVKCLPCLRAHHRFGYPIPDDKTYATVDDKVFNACLAWLDLGLKKSLLSECAGIKKYPAIFERQWNLAGDAHCKAMDIHKAYAIFAATPSDINEHMGTLKKYASLSAQVTELGTRDGVSTRALRAGCNNVTTVDVDSPPAKFRQYADQFGVAVVVSNSLTVNPSWCDMLFMDTLHTANQVGRELDHHGDFVRRFIAIHDTNTFGERGQDGGPGINSAIYGWLGRHKDWSIREKHSHNNGLTILERST
jgi:glycosyltransferase involved in cell wall biosynthesis